MVSVMLLPLTDGYYCWGDSGGGFLLPRLHQIFFHSYDAHIHANACTQTHRVCVAWDRFVFLLASGCRQRKVSNRQCLTSFRRHTHARCTGVYTIRCDGPRAQRNRAVMYVNVHLGNSPYDADRENYARAAAVLHRGHGKSLTALVG